MHNLPLLLAHTENFIFQPIFAVGAKVFYVHRILADELINLRFETCRMREVVLSRIRSQKTSNADAIDPPRRIIRRHAYNDRPFAFPSEVVPHSERLDRGGVRETEFVVGIISPIAKAIHSERTRV